MRTMGSVNSVCVPIFTTPTGRENAVFAARVYGADVTFMTFGYLARCMMLSVTRNKPLLAFPELKISIFCLRPLCSKSLLRLV